MHKDLVFWEKNIALPITYDSLIITVKTKNVDQTITNILEGRVQYTPISRETKPATPKTSPASSASTSQPQNNSMIAAASTFGKTAHERNLSFQERKKLLIENARRRYIEKHNLNITLNNCWWI